ncbi:MAG: arylsulfatase, partial [Isosphaeraceae bacterium]|nr:arylsulfatase [Isosphaeraceae bacterium]
PNIVLILADDMGYGDPGCYNPASKIPTPNIDRLAAGGMRFVDAHTPSSVCSPTRYGLLTGRYAWRTRLKKGVLDGYSPALIEPGRLTIASLLKQHGYHTAGFGKWHLGLGDAQPTDYDRPLRPGPATVGFDTYFGIPASLDMPPYVFFEDDHVTEAPTGTIAASEMRRKGGKGYWRAGAIAPSFRHIDVLPTLTQRAISFIENQAGPARERPFFLYVPLNAPHTPWLPTEAFTGKSGAGPYGDFVVQVDATVGQVLAALDRAGLTDNTLVLFTSDNGAHWLPSDIAQWGHRANGPLRGQKADAWEGGHRVPFLARWPGKIRPGSTSEQTICLTDVFATVAAIVGASLPDEAGEDSINLLPALLGEAKAPLREAVVHHSADGLFAIRQGPWKLILGLGSGGFSQPKRLEPEPGGPAGQLYNLADDPGETKNLYQEHPEIVRRLTSLLEKYQQQGRSRSL